MSEAVVRFYGCLNDLRPPEARTSPTVVHRFDVNPSLKSVVESFGVPHTEIELAVVNGEISDLSRRIEPGDRIAVYPPFRSIHPGHDFRAEPLCFVLDIHLGRLVRWLRMLGFDARLPRDSSDANLARLAASEDLVLLTRDRGLLMRAEIRRGYWLRSSDPKQQLSEVVERYGLLSAAAPFTRCLECNAGLEAIDKRLVSVPEPILARHEEFRRCPLCRRVFWQGSHYRRMAELIEYLRKKPTATL